ncbi:hypothetical protein BH20ACT8_BH20ACT8_13510 [soil metagenome]|jgi:hypothetical protein
MSAQESPAATVEQLRLGAGFGEEERPRVLEVFRKLDRRLKRFSAGAVDMQLSVKERDTPSQKLTLECWIAGRDRIVATSTETDLGDALMDCREDLWRQIDDAVNRRIDRSRKES